MESVFKNDLGCHFRKCECNNDLRCYILGKFDLVSDDIPAWFRVEQGRMIWNVIFLVFRNFRKSIVSFQNWKSFAEEIESLCFDHVAEIRKKKMVTEMTVKRNSLYFEYSMFRSYFMALKEKSELSVKCQEVYLSTFSDI